MSVFAERLLAYARQLRADPTAPLVDREIVWRDAITRAYYAAFLQLQEYLEDRGIVLSIKDVHKSVREQIMGLAPRLPLDAPEAPEEIIASTMARLFKNRVKADYKPKEAIVEDDAKKAVEGASRIFGLVEELRG